MDFDNLLIANKGHEGKLIYDYLITKEKVEKEQKMKRYFNRITGHEYPAKPKDKRIKLIVVKVKK